MIACREQRADVDRQRSPRPAYRADETQPQQGRYNNRHKIVVTVESHFSERAVPNYVPNSAVVSCSGQTQANSTARICWKAANGCFRGPGTSGAVRVARPNALGDRCATPVWGTWGPIAAHSEITALRGCSAPGLVHPRAKEMRNPNDYAERSPPATQTSLHGVDGVRRPNSPVTSSYPAAVPREGTREHEALAAEACVVHARAGVPDFPRPEERRHRALPPSRHQPHSPPFQRAAKACGGGDWCAHPQSEHGGSARRPAWPNPLPARRRAAGLLVRASQERRGCDVRACRLLLSNGGERRSKQGAAGADGHPWDDTDRVAYLPEARVLLGRSIAQERASLGGARARDEEERWPPHCRCPVEHSCRSAARALSGRAERRPPSGSWGDVEPVRLKPGEPHGRAERIARSADLLL